MVSTARPCLFCKGSRHLCGNSPCPLLARFRVVPKIRKDIGTEFFGPNYNVFVGKFGYPNVGIGPLAAIEEQPGMDNPKNWVGMDYGRIVEMRSLMIRSGQSESVFSRSAFIHEVQQLAMAAKPTDIEMSFSRKPHYKVSFSDIVQPMGPSAPLEKMKVVENVRIDRKVEYIVGDEMKAVESAWELYRHGQDVYKVTSILSSGALGNENKKKLVPTRWSITATDDMVAKRLMENIRQYQQVSDYIVFDGRHLDNHFVILVMPGNWEFENFEAWAPGTAWSQGMKETQIIEDCEGNAGKPEYSVQAGGYYAARLAACEYLESIKRQGRVFSVREVYEGYVVPLGVAVVREAARLAMASKPARFSTLAEALAYMGTKLRLPVSEYQKRSRLLLQRRLTDF